MTLHATPDFHRLGTKSERRIKCQGRSTAEKQNTVFRLYTLDLLLRRSVTLPDAVKWDTLISGKRAGVMSIANFTADFRSKAGEEIKK